MRPGVSDQDSALQKSTEKQIAHNNFATKTPMNNSMQINHSVQTISHRENASSVRASSSINALFISRKAVASIVAIAMLILGMIVLPHVAKADTGDGVERNSDVLGSNYRYKENSFSEMFLCRTLCRESEETYDPEDSQMTEEKREEYKATLKDVVHDGVKVEQIGPEKADFTQEWKVTFNRYGLNKLAYRDTEHKWNYTVNPWYNIILSRDLTLVDNVFHVHQQTPEELRASDPQADDAGTSADINVGSSLSGQTWHSGNTYLKDAKWETPETLGNKIDTAWLDTDQSKISEDGWQYEGGGDIQAKDGTFNWYGWKRNKHEESNRKGYEVIQPNAGSRLAIFDYNGSLGKSQSSWQRVVTFTFKTKRNPYYRTAVSNRRDQEITYVAGHLKSYQGAGNHLRTDMRYAYTNRAADLDGDNASDYLEPLLCSSPILSDSDGDGRTDGEEIVNLETTDPTPQRDPGTGMYKINGSNPAVGVQPYPEDKVTGIAGEKIHGKTRQRTYPHDMGDPPILTESLWVVRNGEAKFPIAEVKTKDDGSYVLTIGKIFKRLENNLNEYGNNIELDPQGNPVLVDWKDSGWTSAAGQNSGEDYRRQPGDTLEMKAWSDGWGRCPIFLVPELSDPARSDNRDPENGAPSVVTPGDKFETEDPLKRPTKPYEPGYDTPGNRPGQVIDNRVPVDNYGVSVTPEEKEKIKDALLKDESFASVVDGKDSIDVHQDGGASITYKDGSKGEFTYDQLTRPKPRLNAQNSTLTVDYSGAVGRNATITYMPKDQNGDPFVTDGSVVVTVPDNSSAGSHTVNLTKSTDGTGTWTGTTKITKAGTNVPVTSTVDGQTGPSTTYSATAGTPADGNATVTLTAKNPVSESDTNPVESTEVTVEGIVKDAEGNVVADGTFVDVVIVTADGEPQVIEAVTAANGKLKLKNGDHGDVTFTAGNAGEQSTVTLRPHGQMDHDLGSASVTAGKDSSKIGIPVFKGNAFSTVTVVTDNQIADGTSQDVLKVVLKDKYGAPVKGKKAMLHAISSSDITVGTITDNNDGSYSIPLTSTKAQAFEVNVKYGQAANSATVIPHSPVTVHFKAGAVDLGTSTITISTDSSGSDTSTVTAGSTVTVKVTPKDAQGNTAVLSGDPEQITVTVPGVKGNVTLTKQPDGSYSGTVQPTKVPVKATDNQVKVTSDGELKDKSHNLTITPSTPAHISGDTIDALKGSTVSGKKVAVTDQYGNKVTSGVVYVKTPGSTSYQEVAIAADGTVTIPDFTANNNDPVKIYADSNGQTEIGTVNVTVRVGDVDLADNTHSNYEVTLTESGKMTANGEDSYTVTIKLADSQGNPVTGRPAGDFHLSQNGIASGVQINAVSESSTGGTYTATVTSTTAGTGSITVKLMEKGSQKKVILATGKSDQVEFIAGEPAHVAISGVPETVDSGTTYCDDNSCEITVTDENGNPVPDGTPVFVKLPGKKNPVKVIVSGPNGEATLPEFTPGKTGDNKVIVYKPTTGDPNTADTSDDGRLNSTTITVNPGAADSAMSTLILEPSSPVTGTQVVISGTVKDAAGNPLKNHQVTLQLPDSLGTIQATTDDEGNIIPKAPATALEFKAGVPNIEQTVILYDGTDTSGTQLKSASVTPTIDPTKVGVPSGMASSVVFGPEHPAPGEDTSVRVVVRDQFGNPVAAGVRVNVVVPGSVVRVPGVTDADGVVHPVGEDGAVGSGLPVFAPVHAGSTLVRITVGDDDVLLKKEMLVVRPHVPVRLKANSSGVTGMVHVETAVGSTVTVRNAQGEIVATGEVVLAPSDPDDPDSRPVKVFKLAYDEGVEVQQDEQLQVTVTDLRTALTSNQAGVLVDLRAPAKPSIVLDAEQRTLVSGVVDPADGTPVKKVTVCVTPAGETDAHCVEAEVVDGKYSAVVPELHDGDVVEVTVENEQGNASSSSRVVDFTAPDAPVDLDVSNDGSTVTGKGEPGAVVRVTLPDGSVVEGVVSEDGEFEVVLPDGVTVPDGGEVIVVLVDDAGNVSDAGVVVADRSNGLSDVVVSDDGGVVSGKTDPGSSVTVRGEDGRVVGAGVADQDGNFTITINKLTKDTHITVTSVDPHGNTARAELAYIAPKKLSNTGSNVSQLFGTTVLLTIVGAFLALKRRKESRKEAEVSAL